MDSQSSSTCTIKHNDYPKCHQNFLLWGLKMDCIKKIFVKEGPSLKVKLTNTYTCPKMKIHRWQKTKQVSIPLPRAATSLSMWTLNIIQFIWYQSTWTGPRDLIFKLAFLYFRYVFDNLDAALRPPSNRWHWILN